MQFRLDCNINKHPIVQMMTWDINIFDQSKFPPSFLLKVQFSQYSELKSCSWYTSSCRLRMVRSGIWSYAGSVFALFCVLLAFSTGHVRNCPAPEGRIRTRQREQNQPINHQHRPEYRHIKDSEPSTRKSNGNRSCSWVPELKFWKSSDERSELLILLSGKAPSRSVFHIVVYGFIRWVEFRLEEGEKEVEEVNTQGICHYKSILEKCLHNQTCDKALPIYHPCATNILMKKIVRSANVPIHR